MKLTNTEVNAIMDNITNGDNLLIVRAALSCQHLIPTYEKIISKLLHGGLLSNREKELVKEL